MVYFSQLPTWLLIWSFPFTYYGSTEISWKERLYFDTGWNGNKKQTIYDAKEDRYVGFVDYGGAIPEPCDQLASEALVFLLVGLRGHWKCPIAYFLTDKSSSGVQTWLVSIGFAKTADAGLSVCCVTCDGTTAYLSIFEMLWCSLGKTKIRYSQRLANV